MKKLLVVAAITFAAAGSASAATIHSGGKSGDYFPFASNMPLLLQKPLETAWITEGYTVANSNGAGDNVEKVCNDPKHEDLGIAQANMLLPDCARVIQLTNNPEVHFLLVNKFVTDKVPGYDENPGPAYGVVKENFDRLTFVSTKGSGHMATHKDLSETIGLPGINETFEGSIEVAQYISKNKTAVAVFTQRARPDSGLLKFIAENRKTLSIVPILDPKLRNVQVQGHNAYELCTDQQMGAIKITSACSKMVIIGSSQIEKERLDAISGTDLTPAIPKEGWMSRLKRGASEQFAKANEWKDNLNMPKLDIKL